MNISMFITMLTLFSSFTCLCVEGIKKILNELNVKYSANIVACIVGCVVGIGGSAVYYILHGIDFTSANNTVMLMMGLAVSLGSMVGYDKIVQAVEQLKK